MKQTSGDVFKINITPPGKTFPWIKIFLYKRGIRSRKGIEVGSVNASQSASKTAKEIGELIVKNSKILKQWCGEK